MNEERVAYRASEALFGRAVDVLPGGNTRLTLYTPPYPLYLRGGRGAIVKDVDDNSYIDFVNNFASLIHGHAHPEVVAAASEVIASGSAFGAPTPVEIDFAALLCERYPAIDSVRFMNSGTESVMTAIKAARAFTGRPKIAKFEGAYHGAYDYVEVSLGSTESEWGDRRQPLSVPHAPGVPRDVLDAVVVLPYNDLQACRELLERHRSELAGVLVDPMMARAGMVASRDRFLEDVQDECRRNAIPLILDEIQSLRLHYDGAHGAHGLTPELVCMAKIVGGGFPIGAVGGRRDVMEVFDQLVGTPKVAHAGTFNANPVSLTAGLVAMRLLDPETVDEVNRLGELLRAGVRESFTRHGVAWQIAGQGSAFRVHPMDRDLVDYRSSVLTAGESRLLESTYWALVERGVLTTSKCYGYLSTAMGEDDIERFLTAFDSALQQVMLDSAAGHPS